jgi:hypothetical protein
MEQLFYQGAILKTFIEMADKNHKIIAILSYSLGIQTVFLPTALPQTLRILSVFNERA